MDWKHIDLHVREYSLLQVGSYKAIVKNRNGNYSTWTVARGKTLIGHGKTDSIVPHHFAAAKAAAEDVIRTEIRAGIG